MAERKVILATDKAAIDADIQAYVTYLKNSTAEQYGKGSSDTLRVFCNALNKGGDRLSGILTLEAYHMCGGKNRPMILQAARAMEMIQAYLALIDDNPEAALLGNHAAMTILANLDAPAELRSNVLSITNRTLGVATHGRIASHKQRTSTGKITPQILETDSSTPTILNPLHVGMVLAGADCHATDAITPYALALGQAFQIADDIRSLFGDAPRAGKSNLDNLREGKRTILTIYTLKHASPKERQKLQYSVGNHQASTRDLTACLEIIRSTGALKHGQVLIQSLKREAKQSLAQNKVYWDEAGQEFLYGFADHARFSGI